MLNSFECLINWMCTLLCFCLWFYFFGGFFWFFWNPGKILLFLKVQINRSHTKWKLPHFFLKKGHFSNVFLEAEKERTTHCYINLAVENNHLLGFWGDFLAVKTINCKCEELSYLGLNFFFKESKKKKKIRKKPPGDTEWETTTNQHIFAVFSVIFHILLSLEVLLS